MITVRQHRSKPVTPLRYPGGKTCLYDFFCHILEKNSLTDVEYIEPFAGGAGAALSLLIQRKVKSIVINDLDSAVYCFWKSAVENTTQLINMIQSTEITIDEWLKQREIYRAGDATRPLELGFAALFMNRCNRSGILKGGVIGGLSQSGAWQLDCRFNKEALIEILKTIALNRDRITVTHLDGAELILAHIDQPNSFFYIDPPYYVKGSGLYLNAFTREQHHSLAQVLNCAKEAKWLLSYDNVAEIERLYHNRQQEVFSLRYSAHQNSKNGSELMVYSDSIVV